MPGMISNASSAVGNVSLLNGHTQLAGKTIINKGTGASGATNTIHTVTAGKTFYLLAAYLTYLTVAGGEIGHLQVDDSNTTLLQIKSHHTATYYTQDSGEIAIAYPHPIPIAAGRVFEVYSSHGSMDVEARIIGWEE